MKLVPRNYGTRSYKSFALAQRNHSLIKVGVKQSIQTGRSKKTICKAGVSQCKPFRFSSRFSHIAYIVLFINALRCSVQGRKFTVSFFPPYIVDIIKEKLKTENSYNYVLNALISFDKIVLNEFLHKVRIVYFDNFLTAMYEHFVNIYHAPTKSDQIVKNLIGDFFQYKISCGGNFTFTGKEFTQKYKSILELMSDESLTLDGYENEEFDPQLNYQDMPMVQQLKSIEIINDPTDATEYFLSDYLTRYYRFMNAFQGFVKTQLMTDILERKLNNIARTRWQNLFNKETQIIINRDRKSIPVCEEDKVTAGSNTFTNTMNDTIPINGYKTDQEFSNGWYLKMSNMLSIVWHYDWFKKHFLKK